LTLTQIWGLSPVKQKSSPKNEKIDYLVYSETYCVAWIALNAIANLIKRASTHH